MNYYVICYDMNEFFFALVFTFSPAAVGSRKSFLGLSVFKLQLFIVH